MAELNHVTIYTDGFCDPNPGRGGFGAVMLYGPRRREIAGGFRLTTNNRMEMMAAIVALEALKERCQVTLYSDSQYLVKAMSQGWAQRWRANGWKRNKRERAINPDLWARLLDLCDKHAVEFLWVRGHAGTVENERADHLAGVGGNQPDLPVDEGYTAHGSTSLS